jgi:hypothetical protein
MNVEGMPNMEEVTDAFISRIRSLTPPAQVSCGSMHCRLTACFAATIVCLNPSGYRGRMLAAT